MADPYRARGDPVRSLSPSFLLAASAPVLQGLQLALVVNALGTPGAVRAVAYSYKL